MKIRLHVGPCHYFAGWDLGCLISAPRKMRAAIIFLQLNLIHSMKRFELLVAGILLPEECRAEGEVTCYNQKRRRRRL